MSNTSKKIDAFYDSHVHWLLTGEVKAYLDLSGERKWFDLSPTDSFEGAWRGEWLMGFGWNQQFWNNETPLNCLDQIYKTHPICFIKDDGHSAVVNSAALLKIQTLSLDLDSDHWDVGTNGERTGVVKESSYYKLYSALPKPSSANIKNYLLTAQSFFLNFGISHIRDMTCSQNQWNHLIDLENDGQIKIFADLNFNCDQISEVESMINFVQIAKKSVSTHLNPRGIKIFFDGSLGSRTALLSSPYMNTEQCGISLWNTQDLKTAMGMTWRAGLEFSVHTLGDEAVHSVLVVARELYAEKNRGFLNLEHVQILRPETIQLMKGLHIRCHLQPSHWHDDKKFLSDILPKNLQDKIFPWRALENAKVDFSFGSDSPIGPVGLGRMIQALAELDHLGISSTRKDSAQYCSHPVSRTASTVFDDNEPVRIELKMKAIGFVLNIQTHSYPLWNTLPGQPVKSKKPLFHSF